MVVDPQERDIESYISFAESKELKITHVFDTHVHADHRSGGRQLAERAGAAYCLHRSAKVSFPFEPLDDGQQLTLGNTVVQVLHTPGHTPESICLLVSDLRRGPEPWFICTGDTLFVGTVGRPDLPGQTAQNAAELHTSLHQKILSLSDEIEIYPAHFAGSACGVGMSGKPASTIASEKRWDPLLSLGANEFIAQVAQDIPPKPPSMEAIMRFNRGETA